MFTYLLFFIVCVQANKLDFDIKTDYSVNDCLKQNNDQKKNFYALDEEGFPYCDKYDESINCNEKPCQPGLKCDTTSTKCIVDLTSCFKYYANIQGNENVERLLWSPDCSEDGTWNAKQCKGGISGRCFCYDKEGTRIFGDAFKENSQNMTCACSRKKAELLDIKNPNRRSYVSFHCDSQGNYEELQCDTGHCWCVDSKTGDLKSMMVPEKAMKYLPCAKKLQGSQYLRKCESQAYAQSKIVEIMKKHGITSPNIQIIACQGDGSYGPYTIKNSQISCVTGNNQKLDYQTSIDKLATINCNCALDKELYDRTGRLFNLVCETNGNYQTYQTILEDDIVKHFCVDQDGNIKLDNVNSVNDCKNLYD